MKITSALFIDRWSDCYDEKEWANVLMQILNPSFVGQEIKVEPIEQASGHHRPFAV